MIGGLESARAKMMRVITHNSKFLDEAIREYADSKPCEMIPESEHVYQLHISKQPPIEISILIGEILYHCKSALDQGFLELVQRRGNPRGTNWKRSCYFPLARDARSFPGPLKDWFPEKILTFLDELQPYKRTNDLHRMLFVLRELSNIDKHRSLNVTVPMAKVNDIFTGSTFSYTLIHSALNDGAQLAWPPEPPHGIPFQGEVKVERKLFPFVAFDEPEIGIPEANGVQGIIDSLPTAVAFHIIPAIQNLVSNP